jgi:hypothetical protein
MMTTMQTILGTRGLRLQQSPEDASWATDKPLPRDEARALVAELSAAGIEASDALDNDDPTVAWVYVTRD